MDKGVSIGASSTPLWHLFDTTRLSRERCLGHLPYIPLIPSTPLIEGERQSFIPHAKVSILSLATTSLGVKHTLVHHNTLPYYPSYLILYHTIPHISYSAILSFISHTLPYYPSYLILYHAILHISYSTILSFISHTLPYYPSYLILYHTIPHISYSTILSFISHTLSLITLYRLFDRCSMSRPSSSRTLEVKGLVLLKEGVAVKGKHYHQLPYHLAYHSRALAAPCYIHSSYIHWEERIPSSTHNTLWLTTSLLVIYIERDRDMPSIEYI
jgi:hypothetical protein